jgi:hypothetical protein
VAQGGDFVDAGAASPVLPFRHSEVPWDAAVARHRRMAWRLTNAENGPFPSPPMRSAAGGATSGTPTAQAVRSARLQRCTH